MADTKTLAGWQARVVEEKTELAAKLARLQSFFLSSAYAELSDEQRLLLTAQEGAMRAYSSILTCRINAFQ